MRLAACFSALLPICASVLALAACSSESHRSSAPATTDGGADADAPADVGDLPDAGSVDAAPPAPDAAGPAPRIDWLEAGEPPVAAPQIPWLAAGSPDRPAMACPPGWRSVTGADGISTCDPWPESGRAACATPFEGHFPGEPGCRAVGAPCPAGPWPEGLPDSGVRYVEPGALGGDGSLAAPFGTLAEAVAAASPGDTIALSEGLHPGPVAVDRAVTVRGACAERTAIVIPEMPAEATAAVSVTADATLRDLSVTGAGGIFIAVSNDATLHASGLALHDGAGAGLQALRGSGLLDVEDVVISGLRPFGDSGQNPGVGLYLSRSGSRVSRVEVRDVTGIGLVAARQADLAASDVSIHDLHNDAFGTGECVRVSTTGELTMERAVCEAIESHAFRVMDAAHGTFRDCVARDLDPRPGRACGLWLRNTAPGDVATLTAERVDVERAGGCGALSVRGPDEGPAPEMRLTDVVMRHFQGTVDDPDWGLAVNGGRLHLERVFAADAHDQLLLGLDGGTIEASHLVLEQTGSVGASLEDGTYTFADVAIRRPPSEAAPEVLALGLTAGAGAHLQVDRMLVEGVPGLGMYLTGENGPVEGVLRDLVVRHIVPGPAEALGAGIGVFDGAGPVDFERLWVSDVRNSAVSVNHGATTTLKDARLENIQSEVRNAQFGEGLWVSGSSVEVERAAIANARQTGVAIYGEADLETSVSLTDVSVTGVRPQLCAENGTCPGTDAATGVFAQDAAIRLARVGVRQASVALQSFGGELVGSDVQAAECAVGLNLQEGATSALERVDLSGCTSPTSDEALSVPVK